MKVLKNTQYPRLALMKVFKKEPNTKNHSGHTGMFKRESINQSINHIRYQTNTGFSDGTTSLGVGSPKQCLSN
jgi:hypothetical protein